MMRHGTLAERVGQGLLGCGAGLLIAACGPAASAADGARTAPRAPANIAPAPGTAADPGIARTPLKLASGLVEPDERDNLSGAACTPGGACLLIGDEMRFARFFTISGGVLTPGEPLFLLPPKSDRGEKIKESDGEGIAFDRDTFYVVGSHSADKKGRPQPFRHFLARIAVNTPTGRPQDLGTDAQPAAGLQRVDLDSLLADDPLLAAHAAEAAGEVATRENGFAHDQHGPNIEGVAVRDGVLSIGFRGPVDGAGAVLYRLPVEDVFAGKRSQGAPIRLKLDSPGAPPSQGVRDLAAVSDGLLILAGPEMRATPPKPELWHWSAASGRLRLLGPLGEFAGDSPEAIALLAEESTGYRLLVLADGDHGSKPMIVEVPK